MLLVKSFATPLRQPPVAVRSSKTQLQVKSLTRHSASSRYFSIQRATNFNRAAMNFLHHLSKPNDCVRISRHQAFFYLFGSDNVANAELLQTKGHVVSTTRQHPRLRQLLFSILYRCQPQSSFATTSCHEDLSSHFL